LYNVMANVYGSQRNYEEALCYLKMSLEIQLENLGARCSVLGTLIQSKQKIIFVYEVCKSKM
jgi:pentatricopeptide repeat protein